MFTFRSLIFKRLGVIFCTYPRGARRDPTLRAPSRRFDLIGKARNSASDISTRRSQASSGPPSDGANSGLSRKRRRSSAAISKSGFRQCMRLVRFGEAKCRRRALYRCCRRRRKISESSSGRSLSVEAVDAQRRHGRAKSRPSRPRCRARLSRGKFDCLCNGLNVQPARRRGRPHPNGIKRRDLVAEAPPTGRPSVKTAIRIASIWRRIVFRFMQLSEKVGLRCLENSGERNCANSLARLRGFACG